MKVLKNLTGELVETDYREPRGILQQVHQEVAPGFFRLACLGSAGLVLKRGADTAVAIPLEELWKLAEAHEAGFKAPNPKSQAPIKSQAPSSKVAAAVGLLLCCATMAMGQAAFPQLTVPLGLTVLPTNAPQVVLGQTTNEIRLYRDRGLLLQGKAGTTNASTAVIGLPVDLTADGSNWVTGALTFNYVMGGPVLQYTNFAKATLDNFKKARLGSITNSHWATVWWTNCTASIVP